MTTNDKNRIDILARTLGLSRSEFAEKLGVTANAVTNWKTRGIKGSSYEKITKAFPQVNMEWLKTGEGKMFLSADVRPHIPSIATAGGLTGFSSSVKRGDCEMRPVVAAFPEYDYTITIRGNSMEPRFESGDVVAIRKVVDFIEWGKTYVLDTADGAVVKRLYDDGQCFRCVSYNKDYPDFLVEKSVVFGIYKVVGLIRI